MEMMENFLSVANLTHYKPEINADGSEKHIILEGARFHVVSYSTNGIRCSEPNCEINKDNHVSNISKERWI